MSDKAEESSKQTNKMETLGYVTGILTTIAFVPQVLRIYKKDQRKTFHQRCSYFFTAGVGMWLLYGIKSHAIPVIVANSIY